MSNLHDYEGRHRDDSTEATDLSRALDHAVKWSPLFPCNRHHPRHSAFVCKVRES